MVELIVAMAVASVAITAVYYTYYSQQESYVVQEQVAVMQQNLRAAMLLIQRDIKMAGCDPTDSAGAAIETANSSTIRVTMDRNKDGSISGSNEDVTYTLSSTDLERNSQLVAENISSLTFTYLDSDGNTTGTLSDIRSVRITLVAATQDGSRTRSLQGRVKCRNLWL